MKRKTPNHYKLRRLCTLLEIPKYAAVGICETLWHMTADYTPAGDIGKLANREIARDLGWEGESQKLIDALVESGLVDLHDRFVLVVHDWPDHCEDAVHMQMARARKYFANGSQPRLKRLPSKERIAAEKWYAEHPFAGPVATSQARDHDHPGRVITERVHSLGLSRSLSLSQSLFPSQAISSAPAGTGCAEVPPPSSGAVAGGAAADVDFELELEEPETCELEDLRTELQSVGITEPARGQLLNLHPVLTASMVKTEWQRCRDLGKGTGILIRNLLAMYEGRHKKLMRTAIRWWNTLQRHEQHQARDEILARYAHRADVDRLRARPPDRQAWREAIKRHWFDTHIAKGQAHART